MAYLLRRLKLGKGSCQGINEFSNGRIEVYRNDARLPDDTDYVFRWGCTSNIPGRNRKIINEARGIHWANDKKSSRLELSNIGLAPRSCQSIDTLDFYGKWPTRDHPVIVRPSVHAQGKNLDFCTSREELIAACRKYPSYYISEYINKVAEYRVFICMGRVVWVANKTPGDKNQIAWNVAQGGRFDNVRWGDWPLQVIENAIKSYQLSGLDFGGVDVMVDRDGRAYTLEINSAPSQTSPYRQECVAKSFMYILDHGYDKMKPGQQGRYLKYIHPALDEKAIM